MKKFPSIKKTGDFLNIYRNAKYRSVRYLTLYAMPGSGDRTRIGICASKKTGNSVIRHRVTRLMREIFRKNEASLTENTDIVAVMRPAASDAKLCELEEAFLKLCGQLGIMK